MRLWIKQSISSFWVKFFGKGGGRCTKPSSGASSHQLPFSTKNLRPPPSIQLLSHWRLPPLDLTGIDFWKCCTNWPGETDFLADCQLIVNWNYSSLIQFWTSWSAPSHQGLTQALTSDQTGFANFVSDCKVIFTTARVVSITKFGVYHNQHRDD